MDAVVVFLAILLIAIFVIVVVLCVNRWNKSWSKVVIQRPQDPRPEETSTTQIFSGNQAPQVSEEITDKAVLFKNKYSELGERIFDLVRIQNNEGETLKVRADIDRLISEIGLVLCSESSRDSFVNIFKSKITTLSEYARVSDTIKITDSSFSSDGSEGDHTLTGYYSGSGDDAKINKIKLQLSCLSSALAEALSKCVSIEKEKLSRYFGVIDATMIKYNRLLREGNLERAEEFRRKQSILWRKIRLSPNKSA